TSDYASGLLNITKIGSGTWTLSGNNASQSLGTLNVSDGGSIGAAGTASGGFANYILNPGGSLVLDDTNNPTSGRLGVNGVAAGATAGTGLAYDGVARTLTMQGGQLVIFGNGSTNVTETINNLVLGNGGGTITLEPVSG